MFLEAILVGYNPPYSYYNYRHCEEAIGRRGNLDPTSKQKRMDVWQPQAQLGDGMISNFHPHPDKKNQDEAATHRFYKHL